MTYPVTHPAPTNIAKACGFESTTYCKSRQQRSRPRNQGGARGGLEWRQMPHLWWSRSRSRSGTWRSRSRLYEEAKAVEVVLLAGTQLPEAMADKQAVVSVGFLVLSGSKC
eukprot:3498254-Pleurochrysis_carterae.AAC.2